MSRIKNGFRTEPTEPYKPHTITEDRVGRELRALELLVNIEGLDRRVELSVGALKDHGLSGPAAVEELRGIRAALVEELRGIRAALVEELRGIRAALEDLVRALLPKGK